MNILSPINPNVNEVHTQSLGRLGDEVMDTTPSETPSYLAKDATQSDFISSPSERNQRVLSVEELNIKHEKELKLAIESIKTLHRDLGTILLDSDSECCDAISTDEDVNVQSEVNQMDSLFAKDHTFQTNVKKINFHNQLYVIHIDSRTSFYCRLLAIDSI